jgi:DNA-binding transcriptional ArsR family regulator
MSSSRLEQIVKHDGRLNLLSCLLDGGPLPASRLAAQIGESVQAARYWLRLLEAFDLVEEHGAPGGGEVLYAATLDEHPDWVRDAVGRHRPRAL